MSSGCASNKREAAPTSHRPRLPALRISLHYYILYVDTCPHHVVVERRPAVFGHEDWLDKETDAADIAPQAHRHFVLAVAVGGHDNGHVNVAVRIGVALAVGAEHHDARLDIKAMCYDLLVSSDESDGLVAAESSSFIHCCSCLVSSIIRRQNSSVSVRESYSLSSDNFSMQIYEIIMKVAPIFFTFYILLGKNLRILCAISSLSHAYSYL